ncbi:TPA: hypothetical protein ACJGSF_004508 [Salmonella enterica subsp. enterica serovar Muenchen]
MRADAVSGNNAALTYKARMEYFNVPVPYYLLYPAQTLPDICHSDIGEKQIKDKITSTARKYSQME